MRLTVLAGRYAVCRLAAHEDIPPWATAGSFCSITRTDDELSIVCAEESLPPGIQAETDFRVLKVEGPLDFSLTGILANLSGALAEAKISLFALSTFDTDYILVREGDLAGAVAALEGAGHSVSL